MHTVTILGADLEPGDTIAGVGTIAELRTVTGAYYSYGIRVGGTAIAREYRIATLTDATTVRIIDAGEYRVMA